MSVPVPTVITSSPSRLRRPLFVARTLCISCVKELLSGETLVGTPTLEVSPGTGLTIASVAVNASAFQDPDTNRDPVPIGKGITFRVTPTRSGTYYVRYSCSTSESGEGVGDTIIIEVN